MKWTTEQQKIIDSRNGNLLVSAAAGSGKTAVLIERILHIISDPENPVDVDRLLVVTFTEAAALEMRTRLYDGILDRIENDDQCSDILRRQLMLLPNANVSTIHSFCISLIHDYYHDLDLDPGFRIGDEGELVLLKEDVMEELLESEFEKAEKEFVDLIDMYGEKDTRNKSGLPRILRGLYETSRSFENPEDWFEKTIAAYETSDDFNTVKMTPYIRKISELVKTFSEKYQEEKKKKRLLDFNDLERFAYEILVKDGKETETAKEVQKRFYEIIIDEYQDINRLQDAILKALSSEESGRPNRFMVGDVKQSIYKFRQACPELFLEKYNQYKNGSEDYKRMELDANFRSRTTVTEAVNFLFNQMMTAKSTGIDYEDGHALVGKADYPETDRETAGNVQLLLFAKESMEETGAPFLREMEAHLMATEIQKIVQNKVVFDKKLNGYRKAAYKDIVVLLRSAKETDRMIQTVFESYNIPCFITSKSGFYKSAEILFVMNLLRILQNPMADIPLIAVMSSRFFNFTWDDLTEIKLHTGGGAGNGFYGRLKSYNGPLNEKIKNFLQRISGYREKSTEMTLSLFLRYIYDDLNLLTFASTKRGGKRRYENLMNLISKAEAFEETSYTGVFDFVRYVDRKMEMESDEGEANISNENDDVVRIMTIHKSKGLEFPFVFLFNVEKAYIQMDERGEVLQNSGAGFALKNYDVKARTKKTSERYEEVKAANAKDSNEEELRLLYVAMTRAREGLYMIGTVDEKEMEEASKSFNTPTVHMDAPHIAENRSYLKLILKAYREDSPIALSILDAGSFTRITASDRAKETLKDQEIKEEIRTEVFDNFENPEENTMGGNLVREAIKTAEIQSGLSKLQEKYDFNYHYDDWCEIPYTVSVSKLKHEAMEKNLSAEERERPVYEYIREYDDEPAVAMKSCDADKNIPGENLDSIEEISGAELGTLYHLIFEKLEDPSKLDETISMLLSRGLISQEEFSIIDKSLISGFFESEIGKRVLKASEADLVRKEKPFIIGVNPAEIFPTKNIPKDSDGIVMVQGIIDLYFEEEDGLVLVDYKTDRTSDPNVLKMRYQKQLDLYGRALEMSTGKKVKEKWVYAVRTKNEILM